MNSQNCLFCKIINKQIPSTIQYESDSTLVINDIHPKAPIHYLIIPKKHIADMRDVTVQDSALLWGMTEAVQEMAKKLKEPASFNLISNNGAGSGQSVFHLHWHFLAGRDIYQGSLSL